MLLLVLGAVAVIVAVRWIADHTGLPAAALLTLVGIGYAMLPGPNVTLDPHLVLTLVLPPLLYSAALDSSLTDIRRNMRTVVSLSVVLVLVTAVLVGVGFWLAVPGATLSAGAAFGQFLLSAAGGLVVGLVVAWAVRAVRHWRRDPMSLNAVSLATPFVAYLAGEELHVSGVLAVVVAGLLVGHDGSRLVSGASRLQVNAVWRLVDFLLEGLVFLLIGQQLPTVVTGLDRYATSTIAVAAAVTVGVVLLLRPLWLLLTQSLPRSLHTRLGSPDDAEGTRGSDRLSGREVAVLSWAGTRGVISLAAIFTLPRVTDSGAPFPNRDLLLFCTFLVVLVTLVGQGATFAPVVRRLRLRADAADQARLRNEARAAAVRAGLARLGEMSAERHDEMDDAAIATIPAQ